MTKRVRWFAVLFAVGAGLAVLMPAGVDAQKNEGDEKAPQAEAKRYKDVNETINAYRMAELGRERKAPEMLITAAGMLLNASKVTFGAMDEQPVIKNAKGEPTGEDPSKTVAKARDLADEANDLFEEANQLALRQKLKVDALIKSVKDRGARDVVGGPKNVTRNIAPGATHEYKFSYVRGRPCSFGFRSYLPMRINVADVTGSPPFVWIDELSTGGVQTTVPKIIPGSKVAHMLVHIHNPHPKAGTYSLWAH